MAAQKKLMTKGQIVAHFAGEFEISKKAAASIVDAYAALAIAETKKKGAFVLPGIGKSVLVKRKARTGRNPATGQETMMNDPKWLRAPTIFEAFQKAGAKIAMVTAKDKLRLLLGKGLVFDGTAVAFSSEKADKVNLKDNGIEAKLIDHDLTTFIRRSDLSRDRSEQRPDRFGVGEKFDALEPFHPDRIAGRILGMGDIVSLVERAAETIEKEDAEKLAAKVRKGQFDMDDLLSQLRQLRKMGGLQGLMGMLPGAMQAKAAMSKAKIDEKQLKRQEAVILSMTPRERRNPDLIHASRKKRIAAGSGVQVQDVNKLLKQHADMLKMMKRVNKLGEKGFMRSLGGMTPPPGFPR